MDDFGFLQVEKPFEDVLDYCLDLWSLGKTVGLANLLLQVAVEEIAEDVAPGVTPVDIFTGYDIFMLDGHEQLYFSPD